MVDIYDQGCLIVQVRLFRSKVNSYEFIPVDYSMGKIDIDTGVFYGIDGKTRLVSSKKFFEYKEDEVKDFYAFPIGIDLLCAKETDEKGIHELALDYFNLVKSYEHICCVDEESDRQTLQFCSFKPHSIENPIYNDWSSPFSAERHYKLVKKNKFDRIKTIQSIKKRIVAQDKQVEQFVTAVLANQKYGKYEGLKNNILIIGPTGVGKTEMCNSIAKILDVPIIKRDATKFSTTGYVGASVIDLLEDLYFVSGKDIERAEKGIIILDEFDKLGSFNESSNSKIRTRDVQQELLGLLGNATYDLFSGNKRVSLDTSKITFVLTGAFQNVFDKIQNDNKKHSIGFVQNTPTASEMTLKREDLAKIGGIEAELLRRIPVIIQMNSLGKEDLKNILEHSEISNLKVWSVALLKEDNVNLIWNNDILNEIASCAYKIGGGASGLQTAVSQSLQSITDEVLDGTIHDCDIFLEEGITKDPSKYLVKKKGVASELSEANG